MLEKIKYSLLQLVSFKQIRIPCVAVLACITVAVTTLLGCSVKTVHISDGSKTYIVRTLVTDIEGALSAVKLDSKNYKILSTKTANRVISVNIAYTFPVFITKGDDTVKVQAYEATVGEILAHAGYSVDEFDLLYPTADTVINKTTYIDYTDIDYVTGTYTQPIPYTTETVYSPSNPTGTKTLQSGAEGVQLVSYTQKLVNGQPVETTVNNTSVVSAAVNAKQIVGTKAVTRTSANVNSISTLTPSAPIELDAQGNPTNFSKKMTVRATAYTYTGNNCSTGVAPQPGYIAVNPNIIPYGTKMYIKSTDGKFTYGYAIAADTGGFVKKNPTNVDLFMASLSECYAFGNRSVEIYFLK